MTFFTELEQNISQFIWKQKRSQIAKAVLRKKNAAGVINLPGFSLYYKATVIKTVWYSKTQTNKQTQKYRLMEQDRNPRINPCTYRYLFFLTKEARIYNGVKTTSSINGAGKIGDVKE